MKNRISVAELNLSQAALLSGKTRETVSRAVRGLQSANGAGNAKFFDSRKLLQLLYLGESGPTYSEAMRRLALSRTALLDHELGERKAQTVPVEQYRRDFQHLVALFRSSLLSRMGQVVNDSMLSACQSDLQQYLIAIAPEGERAAIRKSFCEKELEAAAVRINFLKRGVARDKWHAQVEEAAARLREAYAASLTDKTEATLETLLQARAKMAAVVDAEPAERRTI